MSLKGALICLLAFSIGIDAAKKAKLLKKLAKSNELGYKLEDAVKSNLKDDVSSNNDAISALQDKFDVLQADYNALKADVNKLESTNDIWFDAFRNSTISASGSFVTITYDELRGDNNAMNINTGIFRAPYAGVFEFMFQGFKNNAFDGVDVCIMRLTKNGVGMSYGRGFGKEVNVFGTAILNLVVGDEVLVETAFNLFSGGSGERIAIHFTGKMLK